jgi:MFS family permease
VPKADPRSGIYYGWFVLAACFFTMFMATGGRNGFGVFIIDMTDELGWSRATISLVLAVGWLVNGASQPFLGRLCDRFGGRKTISISLVVLGVCTMLLSQTNSIWFLILVYSVVMSVAAGGVSLVTIHALLARWFYRKRGQALSISTSGASAGALVLAPFAAYLILVVGWRMTWTVLGAIILLLAVPLAFLMIKDDPAEVGEQLDGDGGDTEGGRRPRRRVDAPRGPLEADDWRASYRTRPMWQLTGAYFVCGMTTAIISVHYVPFAIDRGVSLGTAALAFGLMSGLNFVGVLAIGTVSDRLSRKNLLGTVYAVRGLAYLMLLLAPGVWAIWGFAVIAGMSWVASAPLTSSLTADIYGVRNMGVLNGMATFSHQIGGALSIYLGGTLYDVFGAYDVPFAIAGAMLVGASIASYSIREKAYSSRYQPAQRAPAPAAGDGA